MTQDDITQVCQWAEHYIGQHSDLGIEAYRTLSRVRLALGVGIPGVHIETAERAPVAHSETCTCSPESRESGYWLLANPLCPIHGDVRDTSMGVYWQAEHDGMRDPHMP